RAPPASPREAIREPPERPHRRGGPTPGSRGEASPQPTGHRRRAWVCQARAVPHPAPRRLLRLAAAAVLAGIAASAAPAGAAPAGAAPAKNGRGPVNRVLLLSLPAAPWEAVRDPRTPRLDRPPGG